MPVALKYSLRVLHAFDVGVGFKNSQKPEFSILCASIYITFQVSRASARATALTWPQNNCFAAL